MQLYGLIGRPLGHSFSAAFFAEKFQREGIEAQYLNFPLQTIEELPALLAAHPDLQGFNVTIPYKQAVQAYLADIAPEAREIGAVNVVRVERLSDGTPRLTGYNTDVIGFARSLRPLLQPHHRRALVLGTGGASLAVVYALRRLGIEPVYVSRTASREVSREASRGGGLLAAESTGVSHKTATAWPVEQARSEGSEGSGTGIGGQETAAPTCPPTSALPRITYSDLTPEVMHSHQLIVNCSPVGMYPHVDAAPAIPYDLLTPRHLLYDLVYNPDETRFMQLGAARGATVKNGLEMLHLQALAAWEIWNN